jgi:anti-sigma regulatory factor (Ser/Thr protein kinase)
MRTGAAADHVGFYHEGAIFGSDAEFTELGVPFLLGGLEAGEPTYVVLGPDNTELMRKELGEPEGLHYMSAPDVYVKPAATVKGYLQVLAEDIARGAQQIRFITEVPHPGLGTAWDWWGRYESAANDIFKDLPLWAICSYDERITPADVLDEVVRSHPYMSHGGGAPSHNSHFMDTNDFVCNRSRRYRDPLEEAVPDVDVVSPTVAEARNMAARVAATVLDPTAADEMALAVSEITSNAHLHGRAPVRLRMWTGPDRVLAWVHDRGHGLADATAGFAPVVPDAQGGRGLWIASQLCNHLTFESGTDGFTVRLVMGTPSIAG